jgi:hypothetical protein
MFFVNNAQKFKYQPTYFKDNGLPPGLTENIRNRLLWWLTGSSENPENGQ